MKQSVKLLIPLIVVIAIIVYLIFIPEKERETSYTAPLPDLSIDSASVVKIEIKQPNKLITLENVGGVWNITYPIVFQADPLSVSQLLHGFSKFRIGSLISSNPEKQSIFQVDSTGTMITFTDRSSKTKSLIIGKMGPSFSEVYFRVPDSKNVYLGDGVDSWTINKNLREWRDKTIIQTGTIAIRQVVYNVGSKSFTVVKDTSGWVMGGKIVDESEVKPLLNGISNLRADDFIDSSMEFTQKPIVMHVAAAEDVTLSLYPSLPDSSRYFIQTSKGPHIYVVSKWSVSELLKPLEKTGIITKGERQVTEVRREAPIEKPKVQTKEEVKAPPVKTEEEQQKPAVKPVQKPVSKILSRRQREADTTASREPTLETPEKITEQKAQQTPPDEEGELIVHTVTRGETMTSIAKKYGVTPDQIIKWNLLKSISVKPGQELYIYVKK